MPPVQQPGPPPADHNASANLESMLTEWYALKAEIAAKVEREVELRKSIYALAFPDAAERGSQRRALGHGKDLRGTPKVNYTVDRAALAAVIEAQSVSQDVLDAVVRYDPKVSESALVKVTDGRIKRTLASFITSKPGLPALEIVDAKKGA